MEELPDSTRRSFLATAGSVTVPVAAVGASGDGNRSDATSESERDSIATFSGTGSDTGGRLSESRREDFRTRLESHGIEPPKIRIDQQGEYGTQKTHVINPAKTESSESSGEIGLHQQDPTEFPGEVVWEEEDYKEDKTIAGTEIVVADYYMQCFKTDIKNDEDHRYYIMYAWAGCRPQDPIGWVGNLESSSIEYDITSDVGDMKRYKPGGDRNKHGVPMDMSLTVSGKPGGVGGSATLGGQFTLGGGTVRPHRSKMNMDADTFNVTFDGHTEATCEVMGMCSYTKSDPTETTTWDYNLGLEGDRINKCPVIC